MPYERSRIIEERFGRVVGLIGEGCSTSAELSDALNVSRGTVHRIIAELRRRGFSISRSGRKRAGVTRSHSFLRTRDMGLVYESYRRASRDMVLSKAGFLKRDGSRRDGLVDVHEAETKVDTQLRYGGLFREMAIESMSSDLILKPEFRPVAGDAVHVSKSIEGRFAPFGGRTAGRWSGITAGYPPCG